MAKRKKKLSPAARAKLRRAAIEELERNLDRDTKLYEEVLIRGLGPKKQ